MVFPSFCLNCFKPGFTICPSCQDYLSFCGQHHRANFSFYHYSSLASKLLKKTKYRLYPRVLETIIDNIPLTFWWTLLDFVGPSAKTCLIPVPLSSNDQKTRGFNQSEIIAEKLGRVLNLPVVRCLTKTHKSQKQAMLHSWHERKINVSGVYSYHRNRKLNYQKAVIVDDVFTTGSTMREIIRILGPCFSEILGITLFKGG